MTDSLNPQESPRATYSRRLEELRNSQSQLDRRHRRIGTVNVSAGVAAVLVIVAALAFQAVSILWILVPLFVLIFFVVLHQRVLKALRKISRAIGFYERGLARLDGSWAGGGESGERFLDESHPYARDLDLFGRGSLFELLSTARTRAGEETLASWLLHPASLDEIHARQAAITELKNRVSLREEMAVLGEDFRTGVQPEALAAWGEGKILLKPGFVQAAVSVLAVLWLLSLVAWGVWGIVFAALIMTVVNLCVAYRFRERLEKFVPAIEEAAHDLALLSQVLARLEREKFASPRLGELHSALEVQGVVPSRSIARLDHLVERLESREHLLLRIIDPLVFWTLRITFSIESWHRTFGPAIRGWLQAVGEMEALLALAGYAYEHPADVFPKFTGEGPCFDAEEFAHPLLPESRAVRNNLKLDAGLQLVIISGPNMAGKSTLIRAVGANALLAQAGAPVRARRLRLSRLAVAASICVLDSLQGGVSRFYAEITRLKIISDLTAGPEPVLFLLDELLQGTNSHDRRIGAEAMVKSLVQRGAVGLVTTHDLALTRIADSMQPRAANFHFDDRIEDGKLIFDYRLSPGIAQSSNALELMRSIGLEI
ncbi:MAG TPA: DNA mismatch repair protein MutS [Terriglobia bacterium]|nr:DNA mismatch repair protein MutS [Terriglobia bacterium]